MVHKIPRLCGYRSEPLRRIYFSRIIGMSTRLAIRFCFMSSLLIAAPAFSQVIRFDEFPADNINGGLPAGRYSSLGVTFVTTDDGSTVGGIANGDPGNWKLNGTNGPIFSGFNGDSYSLKMLFNILATGFSLDVSRSQGSAAGDTFTLAGYRSGNLVDSKTVTLGDINSWTTVSLNGIVDETRWSGQGINFHPFGVDNVRWSNIPEPSALLLALLCVFVHAGSRRFRKA
jgi:hypothetical protein